MGKAEGEREKERPSRKKVYNEHVHTSCPSAGLSGEVEVDVGEDDEEVEDRDEGEVALLGLTSANFFSFKSTCLLFVPRRDGKNKKKRRIMTRVHVYARKYNKTNTQQLNKSGSNTRLTNKVTGIEGRDDEGETPHFAFMYSLSGKANDKEQTSHTYERGEIHTILYTHIYGVRDDKDLDRLGSLKSCLRAALELSVHYHHGNYVVKIKGKFSSSSYQFLSNCLYPLESLK